MKKYRILVGGKGAECYVHRIDKEKRKILLDLKIEEDKMENDEIAEVLGVHFVTDSDDIYLGPYYNSETYHISVYDENENLVWESNDQHKFQEEQIEYEFEDEDDDVLVVEDYVKGTFYTYEIELEQNFDPTKLTPIVSEIPNDISIVSDLMYSDVELKNFKDYGDYWSKGFSYYLN
jgi:hypothetical protein